MSVVCGVPEGHVFTAHLGSTSEPNPCLASGLEIIVPYQGPRKGQPQVNRKPAAPPVSLILELLAKSQCADTSSPTLRCLGTPSSGARRQKRIHCKFARLVYTPLIYDLNACTFRALPDGCRATGLRSSGAS
jgi:hypothetical protein